MKAEELEAGGAKVRPITPPGGAVEQGIKTMGEAMQRQGEAMLRVVERMANTPPATPEVKVEVPAPQVQPSVEVAVPPAPRLRKVTFRVTKRDGTGQIYEFEATPEYDA